MTFAFFDVAFSMSPHPARLSSLPIALLCVATTMMVAFLFQLIVWGALLAVTAGRAARHFVFLTVLMTAVACIELMYAIPLRAGALLQMLAVMLLSVAAAVGSVFVNRAIAQSPKSDRWRALVTTAPILVTLMFLFVWLQIYKIGSPKSFASLATLAGFVAACALVGFSFWRLGSRAARIATVSLAGLILITGVLGYSRIRQSAETASGYTDGHSIKHVFLITIDTLRRDALSCYGGDNPTPYLDRLANDSVVFDNAISAAPWTLPAMASIMTGMPAKGHTATEQTSILPEYVTTIAERMQAAGYHTGAIVDNEYFTPRRQMDQGFVSYASYPKQPPLGSVWQFVLQRAARLGFLNRVTSTDITDLGLDWVDRNEERDFFMWVHYFDPHGPWQPPVEYRPETQPPAGMSYTFRGVTGVRAGLAAREPHERDWVKDLYDAEVRYVDAEAGRFLDHLRETGLYDDALIVLTSDHGEEFFEHGNFGHGQSLYGELLNVPLMVKLPGRESAAGRVGAFVPTQAIKATVLELCGVSYESPDPHVASLRPVLEDPAMPDFEESPIFSGANCFYAEREAVTVNRTRHIRGVHSPDYESYDLEQDPLETVNIAGRDPRRDEMADNLLDGHDIIWAELRQRFQVFQDNMTLDPETIQRMKALGYL